MCCFLYTTYGLGGTLQEVPTPGGGTQEKKTRNLRGRSHSDSKGLRALTNRARAVRDQPRPRSPGEAERSGNKASQASALLGTRSQAPSRTAPKGPMQSPPGHVTKKVRESNPATPTLSRNREQPSPNSKHKHQRILTSLSPKDIAKGLVLESREPGNQDQGSHAEVGSWPYARRGTGQRRPPGQDSTEHSPEPGRKGGKMTPAAQGLPKTPLGSET